MSVSRREKLANDVITTSPVPIACYCFGEIMDTFLILAGTLACSTFRGIKLLRELIRLLLNWSQMDNVGCVDSFVL